MVLSVNSMDFTHFLYKDASSTHHNAFPSQNLHTKIQTQQHSFDWVIEFNHLKNLFARSADDSRGILTSPKFFLGQEVNKPCKWYLKIKKSTEPAPIHLMVNENDLSGNGFSLYLVLDEVLWTTYNSSDQLVLKTKLSIVNKMTEVMHTYDDDWKCFTKLDQEEWIGSPVFATWEKILLEKATFAEDDKIRIRLDIIIYGTPLQVQASSEANKLNPNIIIDRITLDPMLTFRKLWDMEEYTDLIIICGKDDNKKKFLAHQAFFSQSSPVFEKMIRNEMDKFSKELAEDELTGNRVDSQLVVKIPTIVFEDIEPEVMKVILKQIYCNHLDFPGSDSVTDPLSDADFDSDSPELYENIPFEIADKCIQVAGEYQLRETTDAFFKFFLKKCGQVEDVKTCKDSKESKAENFSGLLYLACKYPPGPKVKAELQQIYQKKHEPTYSSFLNLRNEDLFKKAMAEFPNQFLDIFFGIHE